MEMEKIMSAMPTDEKIKAKAVMEINDSHPIAKKLKELYIQFENKTIKNEEGWRQIGIHKTKWYELKKLYATKGASVK